MNLLIYGIGGTVALLLVVGAILHLAGWPTVIGPGVNKSPTAAWANLLLGASFALFCCSRVPRDHRILWDNVFFPVVLVGLLASAWLFWRGRRTE